MRPLTSWWYVMSVSRPKPGTSRHTSGSKRSETSACMGPAYGSPSRHDWGVQNLWNAARTGRPVGNCPGGLPADDHTIPRHHGPRGGALRGPGGVDGVLTLRRI